MTSRIQCDAALPIHSLWMHAHTLYSAHYTAYVSCLTEEKHHCIIMYRGSVVIIIHNFV